MNFINGASTTAALLVMGSLSCFARPIRMDAEVPVIAVRARRYEFKPSKITLKEGKQVKLVFISDDVTHSLTVKELGPEVNIKKNHSSEVLLTPSKPGNFVEDGSRWPQMQSLVWHVSPTSWSRTSTSATTTIVQIAHRRIEQGQRGLPESTYCATGAAR